MWGFALAFVVGLTALVVWLTTFGDTGLSRADQMSSVVSSYIALASFPVGLGSLYLALRQAGQAGATPVPAD